MFGFKKKEPKKIKMSVSCERCNGSGYLKRESYSKKTIPASKFDPSGYNCYTCKGTGSENIWVEA